MSFADLKNYIFNTYRFKEFRGGFLVTTEDGLSLLLTPDEFNLLQEKKFQKGDAFFSKLERAHIILTLDNFSDFQKQILRRFHYINQGPTLHIVVVTNRCGHKCKYCHAASAHSSADVFDMNLDTAKKVCDTILSSPEKSLTVEFQGGEPLLNFEIIKFFIETLKVSSKDVRFTITTNLEFMSDNILNYFISNNVSLCTSLDGDENIHNSIRLAENSDLNSWKNIESWIKKIHSNGISIGTLATISKKSIQNYGAMVDAHVGLGLSAIFLRSMNFVGTARSTYLEIGYDADTYLNFYRDCIDYIVELNLNGTFFYDVTTLILLKKILGFEDPNFSEYRIPAGSCLGQLAYHYDGRIFSCDEGRMLESDDGLFEVGFAGDSISKILSSDKVKTIVKSSIPDQFDCHECVYKPFCGLNPINNYANLNTIAPINIEDNRCKILMGQLDYLFDKLLDSKYRSVFFNWVRMTSTGFKSE